MRRRTPPRPIIRSDHALIELTQGEYAIVDLEDVDLINQHIWCTQIKNHLKYAVTARKNDDGRNTMMFMHQFLLGFPGVGIDHRNHNGLDNRRQNLRPATDKQNQANQQPRKGKTSRYKGVCRHATSSSSWVASISVNGKATYLGAYPTEEEAALAYNEAAIKFRGSEYTYLNEVDASA